MKTSKIFIILLLFILIHSKVQALDSLKVHVIGYFFNKGESYKFYFNDKVCLFKASNNGLNAYAFYMPIPESIKNGNQLDLKIYKKARFGIKYRSVALEPNYFNDRKYFILERNYRLKNRYALNEYWSDKDPLGIIKDEFWKSKEIPNWAKCDCFKIK